jgi:hypothetical protein
MLTMSPNNSSLLLVAEVSLVLLPIRADGGDDFSNNFATDIAPFLALFGENAAKQSTTGSMGWTDNIISAMAPLGIITAIAGAIRVSGSLKWLKSLIGRAREGRRDAEVELTCASYGFVFRSRVGLVRRTPHPLTTTVGMSINV